MTTPADLPGTQAEARARIDAADKRFSTLRAALAIKGFGLIVLHDGAFAAIRWGAMRALDDLEAVEAFAEQVGA